MIQNGRHYTRFYQTTDAISMNKPWMSSGHQGLGWPNNGFVISRVISPRDQMAGTAPREYNPTAVSGQP